MFFIVWTISAIRNTFFNKINYERNKKETIQPDINSIFHGDCLEIIPTFKNNSVDYSFTSPYNRKRNDKYQDFIDINKDWLQLNIDVITQLLRVTKSTYFITFRLIIIIDKTFIN
jgi:DNA modification methylase